MAGTVLIYLGNQVEFKVARVPGAEISAFVEPLNYLEFLVFSSLKGDSFDNLSFSDYVCKPMAAPRPPKSSNGSFRVSLQKKVKSGNKHK